MKHYIFVITYILFYLSRIANSLNRENIRKNTIEITIKETTRKNNKSSTPIENKKIKSFINDKEKEKDRNRDTISGPNILKPKVKIFENTLNPVTPRREEPIQKTTNNKPGKTQIRQESVEYTLPALPIDSTHKIDYYYPYFYKTHVVEYYDNVDINTSTNTCPEIGCEWCSIGNTLNCKQCRHGYYQFNNKCYTVCPQNYVADIFKRTCHPVDVTNTLSEISYLKAFTVGSCKNICGKISSDCSCLPSCTSEGNCCSDYHQCEFLINKNYLKKEQCTAANRNCDLCQDFPPSAPKCGQCREGLWNRHGECVQACFPDDLMNPSNKICIPNQHCLVEGCAQCVQNNPSVCRTCAQGFYMYNNQCLKSCPVRLRADRIAWVCLEPPVFAWYWIFPSRASCRQRCGRMIDNIEMDCSCHADCFRFANCCQDVEDYCPQYVYWT